VLDKRVGHHHLQVALADVLGLDDHCLLVRSCTLTRNRSGAARVCLCVVVVTLLKPLLSPELGLADRLAFLLVQLLLGERHCRLVCSGFELLEKSTGIEVLWSRFIDSSWAQMSWTPRRLWLSPPLI